MTPYRDRKRHAWLLSLLVPCSVLIGPALMLASGATAALWIPVLFFYMVAPLLDYLPGEDSSNPPEDAVPMLEAQGYYRWITYLLVPALWLSFIFLTGGARRAWALEKERLQRLGLPVWSLHNEILQPATLTLLLWAGLAAWLGAGIWVFLVAASFWANFQLTSANYVEHYGLLRLRRANGQLEPCQRAALIRRHHLVDGAAAPAR